MTSPTWDGADVPILPATAELVSIAWLKLLPFAGTVGIATTLPDLTAWGKATDGTPIDRFITVGPVLGNVSGAGDAYQALFEPVIQINIWAKPQGTSTKPRWNAASDLAELIRLATYGQFSFVEKLDLGFTGRDLVRLGSVSVQREPRRRESDIEALAKYSLDCSFLYSPVHASSLIT